VCRAAKVDASRITAACIGIAGLSHPQIASQVDRILREVVPADIHVVGDNAIALEAAFHRMPGVIVVAGTGSIAYGRNTRGAEGRAGGWGPAISDEGSGGAIGRAAVAAAMRAMDAQRDTVLLDRILAAWDVRTIEDLVRIANEVPGPDFAALFPLVVEACAEHDAIACELLTEAGAALAQLAVNVIDRLWKRADAVRVGITGGVFRNSRVVRCAFFSRLRALRPGVAVNFAIVDPVLGALDIARHAALGAVARQEYGAAE
jgi:N-acetylglucosamine kinase-like BadF-type ATPase